MLRRPECWTGVTRNKCAAGCTRRRCRRDERSVSPQGRGGCFPMGGCRPRQFDDPRRISAADRKQQHRPHEVPPDYYLIPGQPVTATHAFWGLPTQECWELAEEAEQEARWRAVSAAAPTDITINDCKLAHAAPATAGRRCMRRLSERRLSSGGIQPLQSSGGQR